MRRALAVTALTVAVLALPNVASGAGTAPVAREDTYGARTDAPLRIPASRGVLTNDTSSDRTQLRAALLVAPQHGRVTLAPDGSFTYRPDTGYQGRDAFGYRAQDGNGRSAMRPVKLLVNKAPTARPDALAARPGTRVVLPAPGVLGNDSDALGTPLAAVLVSGPTHGTAVLSSAGAVDYRSTAGYRGTDTIVYRARDRYGLLSAPTTLTITVAPPNRAPVAVAEQYTTTEDIPLEVPAPGVLGNDTDADGDALVAELVGFPTGGNVALEADGSFVFEPDPNQDADVTFRYRVGDGTTWSAPVEVLIDVIADNDPPVTESDYVSLSAGTSITVPAPGVLANDGDPIEFDSLTAQMGSQPTTATVTMHADGSFTITADPGTSRFDSFTYLACDGGGCTPGEVTVEIFGNDV